MVAIDADMRDAGRGHEVQHAFEQAVAGAQDRGEDQLLAFEDRARSSAQRRRFDLFIGDFEVAGDFIAEQCGDLAQQAAEAGGRGSFLRMIVSLCCTSG